MTPDLSLRNAEMFGRRRDGASFGELSAAYGISRARAEAICKRAGERLAASLPMTLPPDGSAAWTVVRAAAHAKSAARAGPADAGCQLCGSAGPLSVALLRVAWEARTVSVKACRRCSSLAWRTVEEMRAETSARRCAETDAPPRLALPAPGRSP
jgi:hypothetical protein